MKAMQLDTDPDCKRYKKLLEQLNMRLKYAEDPASVRRDLGYTIRARLSTDKN